MRAAVRDSDHWSILNLFPRSGIDPQLPSPSSGSRGPGEPLPFAQSGARRRDGSAGERACPKEFSYNQTTRG